MNARLFTRSLLAVLLAVLPVCIACQNQTTGDGPAAGPGPAAENQPGARDAAGSVDDGARWTVIYVGGQKAGYQQTTIHPFEEHGRKLVEVSRIEQLSFERAAETTSVSNIVRSVETPQGALVRFENQARTSDTPVVVSGRVDAAKGELAYEVQAAGSKQGTMPWDASWGGPLAPERSLLARPMQPGERRELKTLVVLSSPIPADVTLSARDFEQTELLDEPRRLLRIEMTTRLGGQAISAVNWADESGEVLKSQTDLAPGISMVSYLTTREHALEQGPGAKFDLFQAAAVKVDRRLKDPHGTRRIVYKARLSQANPKDVFPTTSSQAVKPLDEHTAEITVVALRPGGEPATRVDARPSDDDLSPSSLIQSDDPAVVAMAEAVAPGEQDPWKLAVALERRVRDAMQKETNFSVAMATAAEVARTLRGDCTEHAMLLAALCRARKIPARVAIGLVYVPLDARDVGFLYHMWTEVWIDGRWIPIDATLGRGGIGAAHLTLVESNLKDEGIEAFLPVLQVIGQLDLEIVEAE